VKLRLICVGKLSLSFLREGAAEYQQRIKRYLPFELIELKEEKGGGKNPNPQLLKAREGERILEQLRVTGTTLALDESGRELDSTGLAGLLEKEMSAGSQNLNIIIGGAYGLSPEVKQRADQVISLSRMTFTHQLARLIVMEQLYRGLTIIRNEPYHNV
jgi:23S rRNA (pseudouridine1915-N3)-methyltransferase